MTKSRDRIGATGEFFRLLMQHPKSRYLALENLITGGLSWRIRAWLAECRLASTTEGKHEAGGDEFQVDYDTWQDLDRRARFGDPLSKAGQQAVQRLVDEGVPEPEIRSWIVNEHMDEDGILSPRYRGTADTLVRCLGWIWHGLVVVSAFLFVVYTWSLPGVWMRKALVTVGLLIFFFLMSILMNSTSISALPPTGPRLRH